LLVTLCGVISDTDGWEGIEEYRESKLEFSRPKSAMSRSVFCNKPKKNIKECPKKIAKTRYGNVARQ